MFSKSCEYAFRSVIYLSSKSGINSVVKIQEIADAIDAPIHYTSKVLQQLSRAGIIGSLKGPNGGFFVSGIHEKTKLIHIVTVIDGEKVFTGCAIGLHQCSEKNPCPLHDKFKEVRDSLAKMLNSVTVKDISEDLIRGIIKLKVS